MIYVGNRADTGLTVVIQHAKGYTSEYGSLEQTALRLNDWVQGGDTVGMDIAVPDAHKGKLMFAVTKDGQYINPADVVTFD